MNDTHAAEIVRQLQAIASKPTGIAAVAKLTQAVEALTVEVRQLREQLARPAGEVRPDARS